VLRPVVVLGLPFLAFVVSCGGSNGTNTAADASMAEGATVQSGSSPESGAPDAGSDGSANGSGALADAGDASPACTTSSDCEATDECVYLVGDCAAIGQCISRSMLTTITDNNPICERGWLAYCTCAGCCAPGVVMSVCGTQYALGPTLGQMAGACQADGGDGGAD
jgi:hypothetical protein